jgi:Uma2 family endonuclease
MAVDARQADLRLSWEEGDDLVLSLDPPQGHCTEEQYLLLSSQTNRLLEFTDGSIEVLPIPTRRHQAISLCLLLELLAFVLPRGGAVYYAPLRLQARPGKFREPDLLLVTDANDPRARDEFWLGADVVVKIVSPDRPQRDTAEKPFDYAEAGIPEYWIVNPLDETLTALTLKDAAYAEHGLFRRGERATSMVLDGFGVSVDDVFDAR